MPFFWTIYSSKNAGKMYHVFKPQKQKKHYRLIDDSFIIIVFLGLLKDHVT